MHDETAFFPHYSSVETRDIAFGQPDGVPFLPADGHFVPNQGNNGRFSFVVADDELVHR
jgi:hypothetical protein